MRRAPTEWTWRSRRIQRRREISKRGGAFEWCLLGYDMQGKSALTPPLCTGWKVVSIATQQQISACGKKRNIFIIFVFTVIFADCGLVSALFEPGLACIPGLLHNADCERFPFFTHSRQNWYFLQQITNIFQKMHANILKVGSLLFSPISPFLNFLRGTWANRARILSGYVIHAF